MEMENEMPHTRLSNDEIVSRGQDVYDRQIGPSIEPWEHGRFVAIDVESGDYAVADTAIEAIEHMRTRRPEAALYIVRAGHNTAYRLKSWTAGRP
jgi:hypothetical protein